MTKYRSIYKTNTNRVIIRTDKPITPYLKRYLKRHVNNHDEKWLTNWLTIKGYDNTVISELL